MKRLVVASLLALVGCQSEPSFEETEAARRGGISKLAQEAVRARLRDPESARFSSVFHDPADSTGGTVCGFVNAKNGFGGYTGDVPFVVILNQAFLGEETRNIPPAMRAASSSQPCQRSGSPAGK